MKIVTPFLNRPTLYHMSLLGKCTWKLIVLYTVYRLQLADYYVAIYALLRGLVARSRLYNVLAMVSGLANQEENISYKGKSKQIHFSQHLYIYI